MYSEVVLIEAATGCLFVGALSAVKLARNQWNRLNKLDRQIEPGPSSSPSSQAEVEQSSSSTNTSLLTSIMSSVSGSKVAHAINVIVTPAASARLSTHELVQWVNDTLHTDTVFKIQDLGTGEYYCLLMNQLFYPREPVQWKKMRFNSKAETDLINNWRAFQAGLKTVGIDKEIPIGRLIAKKPGDNVEFAQWFHKFYVTNMNKDPNHPSHAEYDPLEERRRRGIELVASDSVRPKLTTSRLTKPKSSLATRRPGSHQKPRSSANLTPIKDMAENGGDQAPPPPETMENALMKEQVKNLRETITFLERERDFYFGKLRDIEILCQDQPFGNSLPVTEVLSILYTTEEGFASPEPESECSSPSGASIAASN